MLKNSNKKYGIVSQLFHWSIACLTIIQFYLVYQRAYFSEENPLSLTFILTHKSLGMLVLLLAVGFAFWRLSTIKPSYPKHMPNYERHLSLVVQRLLLLAVLIMPISGYLMSTFSNRPINWFGLFTWPMLFSPNQNYAGYAHSIHVYASYLMIGCFSLHIAGVLKHQLLDKDDILQRMLPW